MNFSTACRPSGRTLFLLGAVALLAGCKTAYPPGTSARRTGDEIVVAGQLFHTGTKVVTWMDPGGYDAYRVERRFSPIEESGWETSHARVRDLDTPNRYNLRSKGLSPEEIERVRGGGWDLPTLRKVVDEFVIHFDVCGTSRQCFKVLHDLRGLSVHFMLDLDGTIYQTLDLKERAWQATVANSRSVGIEIANMGAYGSLERSPLAEWYKREPNGQTVITLPQRMGDGGIRTKSVLHPARPEPIWGHIQGKDLVQYDYTPQQYEALIKLTATLCTVLPKIKCEYPKDAAGKLITKKLPEEELNVYEGVLGHYHIQTNKVDPGPAFQWDYVINSARRLTHHGMSEMANQASLGHMRPRF